MAAITGDAKRLGIFFFYDSEGVVDDYVDYLLKDMVKNVSELAVVVNGKLDAAGRELFKKFTSNLIVRENRGLDVWAYKTALDSYGWKRLAEFDEIVLFNSTIMGPVYPFEEMFSAMNPRDIDFWGITWFHEYPEDPFGTTPEGYIPRHLQSHFHVYRRSLVSSAEFQNYWDTLPPIKSYLDSVGRHEIPFTKRFEQLGFKSDVYVNTEDLDKLTNQPILFAPKILVAQKRCPIFKRRSFFHPYDDVLNQSVGNATVDLYEYLRDYTDFDTNLIWNNALRSMNMADLVKNLKLTYVLPTETLNPPANGTRPQKLALIIHVYYLDLLEQTLSYARSMPEGSDLIITVAGEEKAARVREACQDMPYNVQVRLIENRGRDVSAILVGAKDIIDDYDLVCFMHDKKVTQLFPGSIGDGFAYKCFENMLPSREFVQNVVNKFTQEPRLGMLFPTAPNHADYFLPYAVSWGPNYEGAKTLLEDLGIKVPLNPYKEPIAPLGTMFWFRPQALRPLFSKDWQWEDFAPEPNDIDGTLLHAVERAYGYVSQAAGFFNAWLFADRFARIELTNLGYYVQQYASGVAIRFGGGTSMQMLRVLHENKTLKMCLAHFIRMHLPKPWYERIKRVYLRMQR
ncbi:rhamnan synthesis F family protein [Mobiluncus mulieris]|uniref:rhamnan synthesis F family protein n=1 Tax=Mobiluncus mulieris TaxID=2052 RepID=UPI00325ACF1F